MYVHFHIHYKTAFGEQIGIQFNSENEKENKRILLQTYDGENWTGSVQFKEAESIFYKYILLKNDQIILSEWGKPRWIPLDFQDVFAEDKWRPRANQENAFLSTAFTKSIFRRHTSDTHKYGELKSTIKNKVTFRLTSACIQPHLKFGVLGNIKELGEWKKPLIMEDVDFPLWTSSIQFSGTDLHIEYKYVICDQDTGDVKVWEDGANRIAHFVLPKQKGNHIIQTDENFRFKDVKWRGAGVAIPVFSMRSKQGMGIGEFSDLQAMTDWAHQIGMNIIQILPVNDTIANKTWQDSYPYAAISVFALHPLYIHLQSIAAFKNKDDQKAFNTAFKEVNELEQVDFEKVLEYKFKFLHLLFDQEYERFSKDSDARAFISLNADWLRPYAAFCHLRDKYKTCNFNNWPEYAVYSSKVEEELLSPTYHHIRDIEFYYFVQYYADKQLTQAKDYARTKGVVLKGDLPIGIYRYSCDAWVAPQLYNMNEQAGAPPDDYAVLGQNWGFPTYNWNEMAKDGFAWWRKRMQQLNRHFDALRIDHILGFFRIWQIPTNQVEGTLGMFNPRLPVSRDELAQYGITGDLSRYTLPYITRDMLIQMFGNDADDIFAMFFSQSQNGQIIFKSSFDNQQKISTFIFQNLRYKKHEKNLLLLMTEVLLLVEDGTDGHYFNPRITLSTTTSYAHLDDYSRSKFNKLYDDYYFSRHDEYWKQQALWKLPAILDASEMLICGEDLGMIPKAVPGVMKDLNIISLEIQRMPKGNNKFGQVSSYPYFSVCSPSCHDMSTIRGWWQADHENAKDYYYHYLHWYGLTPQECNTEIVQAIVEDHMSSPSMMAIFPIQDLVGMDETLRKKDPFSEQINEPSNSKHYWRYRFHLNMEDLQKADQLNTKIKNMVYKSGRES